MTEAVIVTLISSGVTLIGTIIAVIVSHRQTIATLEKNSAVADERIHGEINVIKAEIQTLSNRVEAHNKVVERTYELERRTDVLEEKAKVANHRIDDIEGSLKHD